MSKLIIFDIDGTLANTKKVDDDCFIRAFQHIFNIDLREQDWSTLQNVTDGGITEEIILNHWGRIPNNEEYQKMKHLFFQFLEEDKKNKPELFQEIPGASKFFHDLKNINGYYIALATGAWEKSAALKLSAIGIDPSDIAFANGDHHHTRAGIMEHAIWEAKKMYDIPFKKIIYFGDGHWDFITCKKLNIPLIGIDVLNDGKLKKLGTEFVFENFSNPKIIWKAIEEISSKTN